MAQAALHGAGRPGHDELRAAARLFFYFLFYLLRIFKWPESVILGTVGVPTILLILLVAVPFIDRRLDRRAAPNGPLRSSLRCS